jgi:hypothetical protein
MFYTTLWHLTKSLLSEWPQLNPSPNNFLLDLYGCAFLQETGGRSLRLEQKLLECVELQSHDSKHLHGKTTLAPSSVFWRLHGPSIHGGKYFCQISQKGC